MDFFTESETGFTIDPKLNSLNRIPSKSRSCRANGMELNCTHWLPVRKKSLLIQFSLVVRHPREDVTRMLRGCYEGTAPVERLRFKSSAYLK